MADVSLKIIDSQNGLPLPCWISLAKVSGEILAPVGWLREVPTEPGSDVGGRIILGGLVWFAISGECELPGNQGECVLRVSGAPGFYWTDHPVNLFVGRLAVRLSTTTPSPGIPEGFITADLRSHSVSAGVALAEARAGNLQVVQVVASKSLPSDPRMTNLASLTEALDSHGMALRNGCLVSRGTLNIQLDSGSLALLDCHRPVFPLCIDESNAVAWSLLDWTAQCHRVRGLTVWADHARDQGHQSEAVCAVLEGEIDCFEIVDLCEKRPGGLSLWYAMAGAGFFIPLTGASAKDSNKIPIGYLRTIFPVQGGLTSFSQEANVAQKSWVEGAKSGCSVVTRWPFLLTQEINQVAGFFRVTTEIGPLAEPTTLEWVRPDGQVLAQRALFPADVNQLITADLPGPLPNRLAARLRDQGGDLIAHESFHRACNKENGRPDLNPEMTRQLVGRLRSGIQWIENRAGTKPEGEMLYRKELFTKWVNHLLNRKTF